MTTKEKFGKMITTIEENLDSCLNYREIAEIICSDNFISFRDMDAIFKYLMDYSLSGYIKERKMMYACWELIDGCSIEEAVEYSGYDNQSSFSKKFKEVFATSPKEAQKSADKSIIKPMVKWDDLSMDFGKQTAFEEAETSDTFKFGLSLKQYKLISEAENLQVLYEFNDVQSDVAFEIATEENVPLRLAFDYIEYISLNNGLFDEEKQINKNDFKQLINEEDNELLFKLYVKHLGGDIELNDCAEIIDGAIKGQDLLSIEKYYYLSFINSDFDFDFGDFQIIVENFKKFNGNDFEDYLELLFIWGFEPKDAAKGMDFEIDYGVLDMDDDRTAFELYPEEYEGDDFNQDTYDADNPCYNDDEDDEFEGFQIS